MAEQTTEKDRKPQQHDDDVVGKAYDSRLMGRLLTYLRPYKLQAVISLVAILLKAGFGCARALPDQGRRGSLHDRAAGAPSAGMDAIGSAPMP